MPVFRSYDESPLHYRELGPADSPLPPLVCLAGGPGRDAEYLGDLGGLSGRRRLIVPDSRGTGRSPVADDPFQYAFPRLAEDVEALRTHLGLERFALLGHDAGAATAQAYAAAHPERLSRLAVLCPGSRLQGGTLEDAREIFLARSEEEWWPRAAAAVEELSTTCDLREVRELLRRAAPLAYGRWEEPQRAHADAEGGQLGPVPRAGFWQGVDDAACGAVLAGLRRVECPVLVVTGALDGVTGVRAGDLVAESFPAARHLVRRTLPDVGHYPWVDDPGALAEVVADFLRTP